jgi:hypothetical protein
MMAILTQQKCIEALKGVTHMLATLSDAEKTEMDEKALSAIILCLGDKVLREVAKEKSVVEMWTKHKQLLKQQLYFFRMVENKSVVEQLTEFNKIIDDLANIGVNLEDEYKVFHGSGSSPVCSLQLSIMPLIIAFRSISKLRGKK